MNKKKISKLCLSEAEVLVRNICSEGARNIERCASVWNDRSQLFVPFLIPIAETAIDRVYK